MRAVLVGRGKAACGLALGCRYCSSFYVAWSPCRDAATVGMAS